MENNFLLESLTTCHDANTNLVMYFMVNTAITNYIDQCNLTEDLKFPILTKKQLQNIPYQYFLMTVDFMIL